MLHAHFNPAVINPANLHIDPVALDALGRMGGQGYSHTRDLFDLPTMSPEQWSTQGPAANRRK